MSTTQTTPSSAVQHMIDLRLDAVDRALMGLLSRKDRLETVAQVETRIRELAAADSAVEANLQAQTEHAKPDDLARLGEGAERGQFSSASQPLTSTIGRMTSPSRIKQSALALSSGISGIVAILLLFVSPIAYFAIASLGSDETVAIVLLAALVAAVAIGGTAAVVLGIVALVRLNRRAGRLVGHGWAITGLCTGPLPMLAGGLIGLIAGLNFPGIRSVSEVEVQTASMPPGPMVAPAYGQPTAYAPGPQPQDTNGYVPNGQPEPYGSGPQPYASPASFPPPSSLPQPSYDPNDYPPPVAEHVDSPSSRVQPEPPMNQPVPSLNDDAPNARPEAAPASLSGAPATPEPTSLPAPSVAE